MYLSTLVLKYLATLAQCYNACTACTSVTDFCHLQFVHLKTDAFIHNLFTLHVVVMLLCVDEVDCVDCDCDLRSSPVLKRSCCIRLISRLRTSSCSWIHATFE